jgi:hypothetical protein
MGLLSLTVLAFTGLPYFPLNEAFQQNGYAPLTVSDEATGSTNPPQIPNATLENTITNGDFVIRRTSGGNNTTLGDGIDEATTWNFDYSAGPNIEAFQPSTPLVSARLTLTLTPKSSLAALDVVRIEGLREINPPQFQGLAVNTTTTVQIELLNFYSSTEILQILTSNQPQIVMFFADDAIVSFSSLILVVNIDDEDEEPAPPDVNVTGRVALQGQEDNDFSGTTIRVLEDGAILRTIATSANGSFTLELEPGTYQLEIVRAGWQTQTLQIIVSEDDVDLGVIILLLAGVGACPGAIGGDAEVPQIAEVTSSMTPNNNLIFDFNVEVEEPARVWVEFHPVEDDSAITKTPLTEDPGIDHELKVMRLLPDTTYCYQVFATSSAPGTVSVISHSFPGSFTTSPLPPGLAGASFERVSGQQAYDLTLIDFNDADFSGYLALDANANVVWYYQHTTPTFTVAQDEDHHLVFLQEDGVKLLEIRPDGSLVREVADTQEDGTVCAPGGRWHHESLLRPDERVYTFGSQMRDVDIDGEVRTQTGDTIVAWDRNQGTVSTLASLFDLLDPEDDRTPASNTMEGFYWKGCEISHFAPSEEVQDWTHGNSISIGPQGNILVSMRHLNQIISIAPDFRSVQWRLGGPGSDFSFPDPNDQFYHQHTATQLPNGNILLLDNGNVRPEEEGGVHSRALELELDFTTMEARKVWEYRHSPDRFAQCCSSVQRLANGNTLVDFGINPSVDICCRTFTIVEADSQGNAVSVIEGSSQGIRFQYRAYALDSINGEFIE